MSTRNYTLIAIDETADWSAPDVIVRSGGAIYTLYVYDPTEVTHLCEARGSHYLIPVDVVPFGGYPVDEYEREALYDDLQSALHEGCEPCYMHVSTIDAIADHYKLTEEFDEDMTLDEAGQEFVADWYMPLALSDDVPSDDYYVCDEDGCEAELQGLEFVTGLCAEH